MISTRAFIQSIILNCVLPLTALLPDDQPDDGPPDDQPDDDPPDAQPPPDDPPWPPIKRFIIV